MFSFMKMDAVCLENQSLATAAKYAYGSWRKSLVAAGIPPELHQAGSEGKWDKEQVIAKIRERQRQGKSLEYPAVYKDRAVLLLAAKRCFGQWQAALEAAGVVSGEPEEES